MTKVSEEFYNQGYKLDGEGMRIDIINPEGKKEYEIFFLEDDVLIMNRYGFEFVGDLYEIDVE